MPNLAQIVSLFRSADSTGSKSNALQPLGLPSTVLATVLVVIVPLHPPAWLLVTLTVALVAVLVVYLGTYIHFARTNVDATRSEHFSLKKMEYEQTRLELLDRTMQIPEHQSTELNKPHAARRRKPLESSR